MHAHTNDTKNVISLVEVITRSGQVQQQQKQWWKKKKEKKMTIEYFGTQLNRRGKKTQRILVK